MNRLFLLLTVLFLSEQIYSQELNAQVIVNSDLVNQTNQQIFKTLERSLNEFINTQVWTNQELLKQEKITCSFVFNLTGYSNDQFEATLQVQSERPVFDSNYDTPIFNFLDRDIVFSYQEFQPIFFNQSSFESNLVSLLSFYAYVIIGLDADTFQINGGSIINDAITSSQTVYIYDANGNCSNEISFELTVNPLPTLISFTGEGTYCEGDAVNNLVVEVTNV